MTFSLYDASVPVFRQMLGSLDALLDKGVAHATAKGFDPSVLIQARLAPDMFALARQVQIACDSAKGAAARLAGVEIPAHPDTEQTFDELKARIAKVLVFVNSIDRAQIDGQEDRGVTLAMRDRTLEFKAGNYLLHWALPNLYFHVGSAYSILRHNGVEIGKRDFLGKFDA